MDVLGEGVLLLGNVHGEGDLLLGGVLAGVLFIGLGRELLPELEKEENDLDLFLPLPAGPQSAEASLAPADKVVLLEDGLGSSSGFLLLGRGFSVKSSRFGVGFFPVMVFLMSFFSTPASGWPG